MKVVYGADAITRVFSEPNHKVVCAALDDIPQLSLGVETAGGIMNKMISGNSPFPTKRTQAFALYEDNQTVVIIKVFEGERSMTEYNHLLGTL